MKITIDLENKEIGEAIISYTQLVLKELPTLMQLDCNIEIVGYTTRADNQQDIELQQVINMIAHQAIDSFEAHVISSIPTPKPTQYDC